MNVKFKEYGLNEKDVKDISIPYNFYCDCGHVAADHWYVVGSGKLISGRCHGCPMKFEEDVCKDFRPNNLLHLEMKQKEKDR